MARTCTPIRATGLALILLSLAVSAQVDAATPEPAEVDTSIEKETGLLRWGVGALAGPFYFALPRWFGLVGLEGRLGYQLGRGLGIVGTLGAVFGMGSSEVSMDVALWGSAGVLAELTFVDHFFLALGPTLVVGAWSGLADYDTKGGHLVMTFVGMQGAAPSLDFRLGVGLGDSDARTGRRRHFTFGVDVLVLFGHVNGGSGLAVGFAPTLMLGYDAR